LELWNCNFLSDALIGFHEVHLTKDNFPLGTELGFKLSCGGYLECTAYHSKEHLGDEPHATIPKLHAVHRRENLPADHEDAGTDEENEDDEESSTMRRLTTFFGGTVSPPATEIAAKKRASMPPPKKEDDDWGPMRRISNMF
jgi:hypothetical protein